MDLKYFDIDSLLVDRDGTGRGKIVHKRFDKAYFLVVKTVYIIRLGCITR